MAIGLIERALETNIDLFLGFVWSGRCSLRDITWKLDHTYDRIQVPDARRLAEPLFERGKAKLASLQSEMASARILDRAQESERMQGCASR